MDFRAMGLFLLRVAVGAMLAFGHGWDKLLAFSDKMDAFPDPLGVGSRVSLGLVVFAEVVCAAALVVGWRTRIAAAPIVGMMAVAVFLFHGEDPFAKQELAILYGACALAVMLLGPGAWSLDARR